MNKMSGNHASYTFDDIIARDMGMKKPWRWPKYAQYNGNILIAGERHRQGNDGPGHTQRGRRRRGAVRGH